MLVGARVAVGSTPDAHLLLQLGSASVQRRRKLHGAPHERQRGLLRTLAARAQLDGREPHARAVRVLAQQRQRGRCAGLVALEGVAVVRARRVEPLESPLHLGEELDGAQRAEARGLVRAPHRAREARVAREHRQLQRAQQAVRILGARQLHE